MKIKILIVEDEVILADEIEYSLSEIGYNIIGNVTNGEEAIQIIIENDVDIILMDIKLKGDLSGTETMKAIQKIKDIPVIYLTDITKKEIWKKAESTNPVAYLIKPFNALQVDIAFQIALKNATKNKGYNLNPTQDLDNSKFQHYTVKDRVYLRDGTKFIRVLEEEIVYVKGAGSYCDIFKEEKKHTMSLNLSQFEREIPFKNLFRIHKSYIVNVNRITAIEGNIVYIDEIKIPIGASYKEEFFKKIKFI
ncbi:LytR/AlgR family response regulator transcription factor [Kordia jejudonensis]|uniref:LytR/AlgR family response regulator transcription factor n=1 Tax=Kordia jejudonensis TaxID=1348245 RepID=UPI0006298FD6|nr:response regulator [Kordia jejudonensis]